MANYTKTFTVTVDTMTVPKNNNDNIVFNQGDLNEDFLTINLTHNNAAMDITTATDISIYFLKQDSSITIQNLTNGVSKQNASSGIISVAFYSDTLSVPGTVQAEVHVTFPNSQIIVFKRFSFTVESAISGGNASQNSSVIIGIQVVSSVSSLPTASSSHQFQIYAVKGTTGSSADAVYICKMLSDGTYDWVQFA